MINSNLKFIPRDTRDHSKESVELYIRDFEAVKLLASKFDDLNTIALVTRLSKSVVSQYID